MAHSHMDYAQNRNMNESDSKFVYMIYRLTKLEVSMRNNPPKFIYFLNFSTLTTVL